MSRTKKYKECHKCIYNGKANIACLSCASNDNDYTSSFHSVSVEALQGTAEEPRAQESKGYFDDTEDTQASETKAIASFAVSLLRLDRDEYQVVSRLIYSPCRNIAALAKNLGISRQQLYRRIDSACTKIPELSRILSPQKRTL